MFGTSRGSRNSGTIRALGAAAAPAAVTVFGVGDKVQYPRPGPDPRGVGYVVFDGDPQEAPADRSYYIMDPAEDDRFFMNGASLTLLQRRADLPAAERAPVDDLLQRMRNERSGRSGNNGNNDPTNVSGGKRSKSRRNRRSKKSKSRKGSRRN